MRRKPSGKKSPIRKCHVATLILLAALIVSLPTMWITPTSAADPTTWTVGTWTEYPDNSVFGGVSRAYYPCVLLIEGTYHMWYTDGGYQTGYTNSSDGIVWGSPTIVTGLGGNPGHAVVVNVGTEAAPYYRIWYANEAVWPLHINVTRTAESADGINWINDQPIGQINNVIQEDNPGEPTYKWMYGSYGPEAVLHNPDGYETLNETDPMGNKYVMYYDQFARTWLTGGINEAPMLAVSVDGVNWKRYSSEPLIVPSGGTTEWDANYISVWSVLKRDDGYHLWYSGGISDRNDGIGYATSADGLTWTKCAENPLLSVDDEVAWRNDRTYCPLVIEDGGVFKMWFAGKDTATGSYTLGYATIPTPLPDFYDIQHAIDTVDSGDVLVVSEGTYAEAVSVTKSVTLLGAKQDVDPAGSLDRGGESVISGGNLIITADDVTVNGFKITGGYIAAGYPQALDVTISHNIIDGVSAQWGAIHLHGAASGPSYHECDRGYVGYNTISGVTGPGIWTVGNDNVTITHNHILDVTGTAVDVLNHVGTGIEILDNIITNPGEKGINYWAEAGGIIRGNTITGSGSEAIFTDINATIESNQIIDAGIHGIVAAGHVGTVEILENTITNPIEKGINYWAGAGGIIRDNTITGSGGEAIFTDISVTIEYNTVTNCAVGITINPPASDVLLHYNNIYQNTDGVINYAEPQVNATLNWWGTTDPDLVAASIIGSVLFDPWLDPEHPDTLIVNEKSGFYYQTIQSAIDAASDYDIINVPAGVYNERITIEKPLTLRGATADVNKKGYTVPTNYAWDSNVETIIDNPTPELEGTVVYIHDTNDVTFEGFIVQKLNAVSRRNVENVLTIEADTMTMQNITIRNNIIGPNTNVAEYQDGTYGRMGLYINVNQYRETPYGLANSTISGNKIFDCKGNGDSIFIWGAYYAYGARHPSPMEGTVIEDNEISGSHRTGIEIAGGCSGLTIQNNIISNNKGLPTDDPLLKYGSGIVLIRGSSDSESSTGLGPENLTIVGNDIFGNEKNGIYMGPVSKNHNITKNSIHDNGWDGIRLDMEAHYYNPDFETVDRTALFNATENINATYNNIYDNSELGVNVVGIPENGFVLNATLNWWGAASGPDDKISEHVTADPWITDSYGLSMENIIEPEGTRYGSAPRLSNFGFDAVISNLKSGWYRLDSGAWSVLFADVDVPEWNSDNWQVPDFAVLTDGNQTVFFKVADVFGHESDIWSWEFYCDKTAPTISNSQVNPDSGTPGTEFTITTDVEDPAGVQSVIASIQKPDETEVASIELTSGSSYSGIWDSTGVLEGTYYVDITATDNAGNIIEEENALQFPILAIPVINWTCCCIPANQTNYEFDAINETSTSVFLNTTTGTPTVTVACCDPENATGFSCDVDKYIDVQLDDPTGVTSLMITIYYMEAEIEGLVEEDLRLYWWNGTAWKMCSNTGVNTTDCDCYSGYIWAEITADSEPSLSDLTGTPFGANSFEHPIGGTFGHTNTVHLLEKLAGRFLVEHWLMLVAFGLMIIGVGLIVYPRKQSSSSL